MPNTFITCLQIFGIGFSFGIIGPCFLFCTPVIVTYLSGTNRGLKDAIPDLLTFLSGRLLAYVILGALAGLSSQLLMRFTGPDIAAIFNPLAGVVSIILGIIVLVKKEYRHDICRRGPADFYSLGGPFIFGFIIGIIPCAPLLALLLEIALISKNVFQGAGYALSFGLGTFLSGLIAVGAITGLITGITAKALRSERSRFMLRLASSLLLILFGIWIIIGCKI